MYGGTVDLSPVGQEILRALVVELPSDDMYNIEMRRAMYLARRLFVISCLKEILCSLLAFQFASQGAHLLKHSRRELGMGEYYND